MISPEALAVARQQQTLPPPQLTKIPGWELGEHNGISVAGSGNTLAPSQASNTLGLNTSTGSSLLPLGQVGSVTTQAGNTPPVGQAGNSPQKIQRGLQNASSQVGEYRAYF